MIAKFALYQNDKNDKIIQIIAILCQTRTDRHNQVLSCASLAKCEITANAKIYAFYFL